MKKRKSLGFKLIISFIITSIIPIIILNFFSYYNISRLVNENNRELMKYNLSRTRTTLDISIQSYQDVLMQIRSDDTVVELMNKINNREELVVSKNQLRRTLRGYFYAKDNIKDISVITEDGTLVFYDSITGSVTRNSWIPTQESRQKVYEKITEQKSTSILPTDKAANSANGENYLFHMGARMVDYNKQNKEIGVVIISIDESMLENICTGEQETSTYTFIVDGGGTLVSYYNKELLGTRLDVDEEDSLGSYQAFARQQKIFDGKAISVDYTYDEKLDWYIVNVSNQNEVLGQIKHQQRLTIGIMIALLAALLVVITVLIRDMTSSIKTVVKIMKSTGEGELHARVPIEERMPSEVEEIARQYNITMGRLLEAVEKEKQMNLQMKDAEITALEAQLNPHFLYNTLDTINWIAIGRQEFEISRSITALAVILRYGIDNSNGIVTIRQEYEWLKQYLLLQQMRLKEEFESDIDIAPELMDIQVHKLLFQPFVENCIIHGFEGVQRKHILRIHITLEQERILRIVIEDNGKGMSEEIVEKINVGIFEETRDKNRIGLKNAFYRIRLYYGEEADVKVESEEGGYTRVTVGIPIVEKGGDEL